jgi:hypothetical protein
VVHYENLQFYTKMGLIVTKIHRVLSFEQSNWLESYIDFNTQKRKEATSEFEKNLYKLLSYAIFEKCTFNIIHDDVTMKKLAPTKIIWNRPTAVGYCIWNCRS